MADISKITLPSGTTYDIKDAVARQAMSGAIILRGTTTTALTDGATTNPITIGGSSYTAVANDAVFYSNKEFVFDGTNWHEFGDMTGLGALATKDSASGTVAVPKTYTTTVTPSTTTKYVAGSATGGGSATKGTVTVSKAASGTATYTPEGSVSAPTISVNTAGSTTTIKNPTSKTVVTDMAVAAPSSTTATGELVYCSVSGETLSLSKFVETTGASITTSNVTVKNGDASYESTAPTFTGTGARLQTDSEVYTSVTMPSFSSQTIATGISSATTTTATTENKTVTVS